MSKIIVLLFLGVVGCKDESPVGEYISCPALPCVPAPAPAAAPSQVGPLLNGFYRIDRGVKDGKDLNLVESFRASMGEEDQGKLAYMRLALDFEGTSMTVSVDQVIGEKGGAMWCRAKAQGVVQYGAGTVSWPDLSSSSNSGAVAVDAAGEPATHRQDCQASIAKGTYAITPVEGGVQLLDASQPDAVALILMRDDPDVDLEAITTARATGKDAAP